MRVHITVLVLCFEQVSICSLSQANARPQSALQLLGK